MKVYRLEDSDRLGVYKSVESEVFQNLFAYGTFPSKLHPLPSQDNLLMEAFKSRNVEYVFHDEKYRHGFVSIEQFKRWFYNNEILRALHLEGIAMVVYEVPDESVFVGNTQVIFDSNYHADDYEVEKHSLLKYLD